MPWNADFHPGERAVFHMGRYLFALIATAGATWCRHALEPWLNGENPFSLFFLSTLLTVWLCGAGPALFAMALAILAAAHFFVPPEGSLLIRETSDILSLVVYAIVTAILIYLFHRAARQRQDAEARLKENERLSDSLREADRRKDDFLALLAHELRNPLAPVRNSVALLERRRGDVAHAGEALATIGRQVTHLTRLVDDLLDVSRLVKGRLSLKKVRYDFRRSVTDAVEMTRPAFDAKPVDLRVVLPERPVTIEADPVRAAQMIANLLHNASKFTPQGGRVAVALEEVEGYGRLVVSDNGVGLPVDPDERRKIFEPFQQVDRSATRDYQGLGLGLSLVAQIAELHGGSVTAESRGPSLGSCFTIQLPLAGEDSAERTDDESTEAPVSVILPSHIAKASADEADRKTILLVEDNEDAKRSMQRLLEMEGYRIFAASDAFAALQIAGEALPDVVVMDIGLPGMDGYELSRRLRRGGKLSGARFIAMTGWGAERDREAAVEAGFDAHLIKPVDFDQLLAEIRETSNGSRLAPSTDS